MKSSPLTPLLRLLGESLAAGGRRRLFAVLAMVALVGLFVWRPELLSDGRSNGPAATTRGEPPRGERLSPPGRNAGVTTEDLEDAEGTGSDLSVAKPPSRTSAGAGASSAPASSGEASVAPSPPRVTTPPQVTIPRGGEPYHSPAGLVYTRGSAQGHRLRHVLEHAADVPDRPGSHGVFQSNDLSEIVALIDEAYERSRQGRGVQRREEEGRTVLTVDMGRTVGYIGGQSGNRRGRPKAKYLRLVLDDSRVITAYPIVP